MTSESLDRLAGESGCILDVGGGLAPYFRASHILDLLPFDPVRLAANAWGGGSVGCGRLNAEGGWAAKDYTQFDLCGGTRWPFDDKQFALGLCSHCLEDLPDPRPALRELQRTCRSVLIITPSRLLEQMRGIAHPRYCGFPHHSWLVDARGGVLRFLRKTPLVELPKCHLSCPPGRILRREFGALTYHSDSPQWSVELARESPEEYAELSRYLEPFRRRKDLFEPDEYRHGPKYWIWKARQWFLGVV